MYSTQDIKLSFICIANNSQDYTSTVKSILNQKTQYKYKILLGVLNENEINGIENISKENPGIIDYVIFQNKTEAECIETLFHKTASEYITLCKCGDTYTRNDFIEKQCTYLDNNPDMRAVFCLSEDSDDGAVLPLNILNLRDSETGIFSSSLIANLNIDTYSAITMRRNDSVSLPSWYADCCDPYYAMALLLVEKGNIIFNDSIAVLRSKMDKTFDHISFSENSIKMLFDLLAYSKENRKNLPTNSIKKTIRNHILFILKEKSESHDENLLFKDVVSGKTIKHLELHQIINKLKITEDKAFLTGTLQHRWLKLHDLTFVSVICITYNHEDLIRQSLDSFLMQKTTFKYKIFVGEDNGPDGTADIIREYAEKYPDIIVPYLRTQNFGAQKNLIDLCMNAKSPYLAFCEGDDYWTDELKLQKQFEFMEARPNFRACTHATEILADEDWCLRSDYVPDEDGRIILPFSKPAFKAKKSTLAMSDYIQSTPLHTSSYFYRWNYNLDIPEWYYKHFAGDHSMMMLQCGKYYCGLIPDVMSVYRRSDVGVYYNKDRNEHYLKVGFDWAKILLDLRYYFDEYYDGYCHHIINSRMINGFITYLRMVHRLDAKEDFLEKMSNPDNHKYIIDIMISTGITAFAFKNKLDKVLAACRKVNFNPLDNGKKTKAKLSIMTKFKKKIKKHQKSKAANTGSLYFRNAKVKKKPELWAFMSDNNKFEGNARYLFEYVIANHPEINAVWISPSKEIQKMSISGNLPYCKLGSKECAKVLKKASVIFVNKFIPNLKKLKGFNAATKVVRLEFASSYLDFAKLPEFDTKSNMFSEDILPLDSDDRNTLKEKSKKFKQLAFCRQLYKLTSLFVVPNKASAEKVEGLFGVNEDKILLCNNSRSTASRTDERKCNKAVLYSISKQEGIGSFENVVSSLVSNLDVIHAHAMKCNYSLDITLDSSYVKVASSYIKNNIENYENINLVTDDIYTNLANYDVLVTNCADEATDFILQDKPVISLCQDNNCDGDNLMYDYSKVVSPNIYRDWQGVLSEIEIALDDSAYGKEFRKNAREILFDNPVLNYNDSEKIVDAVKEIVGM